MANQESATQTLLENLRAKTGKSLEQWVAIAKKSKLQKHGAIIAMLKADYGVSHGYAHTIATKTLDVEGTDLVEAQYAGAKSALRPVYDALARKVAQFGPDVELAPKKTCVSLRRSKVFGIVQPSTASRLDVGLVLKGVPTKGRLEEAGSFNAMMTHRVRLQSVKDVDGEVIAWLRQAYDKA